ncbi:MAG: hypothetical protein ACPGWR_01575 [Ardenticatenaceae bacterium]
MYPNNNLDTMKRDRPFAELVGAAEIVPMHFGKSRQAFQLRGCNGVLYKLRVCASIEKAVKFEQLVTVAAAAFPRFYGRDRNYLLLNYIDGAIFSGYQSARSSAGELDQIGRIYTQIGEMHATIHQQPHALASQSEQLDRKVERALRAIVQANIISSAERQNILHDYTKLRQQVDFEFSYDLKSASHKDFICTPTRVYYIDEGAIGTLRGLGMVRLLEKIGRKINKKRTPNFQPFVINGYESEGIPFPNAAYIDLLVSYDSIIRIAKRIPILRPKELAKHIPTLQQRILKYH